MTRPAAIDTTSAASATRQPTMTMVVTRRGECGGFETDRTDCPIRTQRYATHTVNTTGKLRRAKGLELNAANSIDATTTKPTVNSTWTSRLLKSELCNLNSEL